MFIISISHYVPNRAAQGRMKVYLGTKFYPDQSNKPVIETLSSALAAAGHETVCVQRDLERYGAVTLTPHELMRKTFEVIDNCDMVVIDLNEKGVGLGIEAGYAHGKGIPVVTVAKAGADISNTLRGISRAVKSYTDGEDLASFFSQLTQL